MRPAPVLDTHAWIWWLLGDPRMPASESTYLDQLPPEDRPILSDISLWEVALLVERGRLELDCSLDEFLHSAAAPATVRVHPISPSVVVAMNSLPETFHRDPADRLIVSTARTLDRPLASRDRLIVDSGLVRMWRA